MTKNCHDVLYDIDKSLWAGHVECVIHGRYISNVKNNKLLLKINGQEFTIFIKKGNHTKD